MDTLDPAAHIACQDCDLLLRRPAPEDGCDACCPRCGRLLRRCQAGSLDRTLAFTIAALILFVVANAFPFLGFELSGRSQEATILAGAEELWARGLEPVALLVFLTTLLAPLASILLMFAIVAPLRFGWAPGWIRHALRCLEEVKSWGMLSVYMLGALVAVVKLSMFASIELGYAFWAFVGLMILTVAAQTALDTHEAWERLEVAS